MEVQQPLALAVWNARHSKLSKVNLLGNLGIANIAHETGAVGAHATSADAK